MIPTIRYFRWPRRFADRLRFACTGKKLLHCEDAETECCSCLVGKPLSALNATTNELTVHLGVLHCRPRGDWPILERCYRQRERHFHRRHIDCHHLRCVQSPYSLFPVGRPLILFGQEKSTVESTMITFCKALVNQYVFPVYQGEKKGYCIKAYSLIKEDLKAVGKAIAEAYATTSVEVSVKGSGQACGFGKAQAEADAKAVAEIFFYALAEATNKYDRADISAEIEITISALAYAYADSWSKACAQDDSSAKVVQETYARASVEVIATLSVWLFAKVDCTGYSGYVEGEADAENKENADTYASSSTLAVADGTATAAGGGKAISKTIPECTKAYKKCCYVSSLCCAGKDMYGIYRSCNAWKKESKSIWYYYGDNHKETSCHCSK